MTPDLVSLWFERFRNHQHDLGQMNMISRGLMAAMAEAIILTSSVWSQEPDAQLNSFLSKSLRDLNTLVRQDPTGAALEAALEQRKVYDHIWLYLSNSNAGDAFGPNPERDRRIDVVEQALDSYQPAFLSVFRHQIDSGSGSGRVFNVLEYSRATSSLKTTLKEITASPTTQSLVVAQAYDLMFRHQIEDESDKQSLMARIRKHLDRTSAADVAQGLIGKASMIWALPEMKTLYHEWLAMPYTRENGPKGRGMQTLANLYARAAHGLMAFGSTGADLLPLLRLRRDELRRADDEHSHNTAILLQQAIDVAEGKVMPRPCGNSKAKYLGVSQTVMPAWTAAHQESRSKVIPSGGRSPALQSPLDRSFSSSQKVRSTDTTPASTREEPTSLKPWAFVIMITAAATGLLWLVLKRRS